MYSSRPGKSSPSNVPITNTEHKLGPSRPKAAQLPVEPVNPDQEYGCKFCAKKFSNIQALGGHQNAHKIERAMVKAAQEMYDNHFGCFASGPSFPGPGPYHGSNNRSVLNNFPHHLPQHGIRIGYNARRGLPLGYNYPYGPSQPMLGFRTVHSGCGAPRPGVTHFPGQGAYHHHVQNRGPNVRFSTSRPVYPDLSSFVRPRSGTENAGGGGNSNETNNPGNDVSADEETGLDLSLKL